MHPTKICTLMYEFSTALSFNNANLMCTEISQQTQTQKTYGNLFSK